MIDRANSLRLGKIGSHLISYRPSCDHHRHLFIQSAIQDYKLAMFTHAPHFRAFTLALIQLGNIGSNKSDNLRHAQMSILKAAQGSGATKKPDLIVLPVSVS